MTSPRSKVGDLYFCRVVPIERELTRDIELTREPWRDIDLTRKDMRDILKIRTFDF